MKTQVKLRAIGWIILTTVALQAACPKPTNSGLCGWASQVEDPSNGCCRIDGPGQIQRKICAGDGASYQCNQYPRYFFYTFQSWPVKDNNGVLVCNYDDYALGPACNILDFGRSPYTVKVRCDNAVLDTSTPCVPSE